MYAGCVIDTELSNGVKYYNDAVRAHLDDKFGQGFMERFYMQLDSVEKADAVPFDSISEKVCDLVAELPMVKDLIKRVDSLSHGERHISLVPVPEDETRNIYLVRVCEDNGASTATYFNFLVDASSMKIINRNGRLD